MSTRLSAAALAGAALLLGSSAFEAKAASVLVNSVIGAWSNIVGGTNVSISPAGSDPTTVSWGTGGTSSYSFDGITPPPAGPFAPGTDFNLGTFTHNNQPINSGTSISGARLTLTINADITGSSTTENVTLISVFDFTHFETPNDANPCANGGVNGSGVNSNGCADIVTAVTNPGASTTVVLDGVEYLFAFSGFLVGTDPFSSFETKEEKNNIATIVGTFIDRGSIEGETPLPAAAWLFGTVIAGAAGMRRWRSKKAA